MMRLELETPFCKKSKLLKRNPSLTPAFENLLSKLADNPFDPALQTHPLTGNLKGKYACSLTHSLRVVFRLYDDIVHLLDIGNHDEVY